MKYNKIVLAGGNGYLGNVLAEYYRHLAREVIILSRKPREQKENVTTILWDGTTKGSWVQALEGADLLVNLCGKNVNCRYTDKNKKEILDSRIIPTRLLGDVISSMQNPPAVWINIASATIYRHAEDHAQDEQHGEIGYGFSIDICKAWEEAFAQAKTPLTRKITLRLGIVLGRSDGVFPRLLNLVKFGLGGKQGDGQQYVSWIHEQDFAACTEWLLQHKECNGVYNCTAPVPVKNTIMMKAIRKAYGMPLGLPAPAWLLEIGALLIGTETELILKSRWVIPARLQQEGFTFGYTHAEHAIHDLLSIRT